MSIISCQNLSVGYAGKKIAQNISFSLSGGDYLCVVGENGSGKSTFMKTILNLIPPLSGNISTGEGLRQNEIGYLPQQSGIQKDFPASVEEIVLSGNLNKCGMRPYYSHGEKKAAKDNIAKLGISKLAKKSYQELSGGQQQRTLLARALCATEKMMLLDEPVSGLDPDAAKNMYETIKELNNEGITIIMISHDISSVIKYATHVLRMGERPFFYTKEDYVAASTEKTNNGYDN